MDAANPHRHVCTAAVSTRAQAAYGVRADVPFDFVVGDKTISAVVSLFMECPPPAKALYQSGTRRARTSAAQRRRVSGAGLTEQAKLVFTSSGIAIFSRDWTPGYEAWDVMKSKEERSLERDMRLVKNSKPERVSGCHYPL